MNKTVIGTCETCFSWEAVTNSASRGCPNYTIGGYCENAAICESYGNFSYTKDALVYSYAEGGSFWTGPQFGCIHYEEKKK